jgi:hypothetical protein
LRLRIKKTLNEIFRGKIAKQVVGTSRRLRRIRKWALWRGRPPPEPKKKESCKQNKSRICGCGSTGHSMSFSSHWVSERVIKKIEEDCVRIRKRKYFLDDCDKPD